MKVAFYTLGCKVNQAETNSLCRILIRDYNSVLVNQRADICIVNVCSVTVKAEKESRQTLRLARQRHPHALLIATGCWREKSVTSVDWWINNQKKELIPQMLERTGFINKKNKRSICRIKAKQRISIKIQDGCNNACTFCISCLLRGKSKSRSVNEIIKEIIIHQQEGCQEIILVGVNLSQWKENNYQLPYLIKKILALTTIPRIRLSSLWPTVINSDLLTLFSNPRLCPHLHLSLQSGSDRVLAFMNRHYRHSDLQRVVEQIKKININNFNLTADVIVGFPGETNKDFLITKQFLEKNSFSKTHIFRYSSRPGTMAQQMINQIPAHIKKQRAKQLNQSSKQLNLLSRQRMIGQNVIVLFEDKKESIWQGFSRNYFRIYLKSRKNLKNKIVKVKIVDLLIDGLLGEFIS